MINIKKNIRNKSKIVLKNEADEKLNHTTGDVYFRIIEMQNDTIQRNEDDILIKIDISLKESLFGFEKKIEHLSGDIININNGFK